MVKYVKDFEFPSSGAQQVRGYMRGGYAKGGAAKAAPKGLSVMIAVGSGKAPPFTKKDPSPVAAVPVGSKKVGKVMSEFSKGDLHSGSSKGPLVKSPKQAMAIALNEARGAKAPVKKAGGGLMRAPGAGAVSDKDMQRLKKAAKVALPIIGKAAAARGAAAPAGAPGAAALPIIGKAAAARGAAAAPAGAPGAAAGPSRAQFDAMMANRAAMEAFRNRPASAMTPAERAQITGGEGINPMTGARFGRPYKKGGSTNC